MQTDKLQALLRERGITIARLAREIGASRTTLSAQINTARMLSPGYAARVKLALMRMGVEGIKP